MRKSSKIIFLFGIILFSFFACEDEEIKTIEEQIIGTWIEKEPFTDGICDTIVFKENNTIGLYFPVVGWDYKIISNDSIVFINQPEFLQGFNFTLFGSDELIVYNFYDRTITNNVKNIPFLR